MLRTTAEPLTPHLSPKERAWIDLFNVVHSPEAFMLGVDFAAALNKRPVRLLGNRNGERYAALSWPGAKRPYFIPIEDLLKHKGRLLKGLRQDDVALATPRLPPEMWRFLNARGYYREIDRRQHEGWLADSERNALWYLKERPDFEPSIALLPPEGKERVLGEECLLSVQVNYQWQILSEIGAHGRTGGAELLQGEKVWVVTSQPSWNGYTLRLVRQVKANEIAPVWGSIARDRARNDVSSLVVLVEPWDVKTEL